MHLPIRIFSTAVLLALAAVPRLAAQEVGGLTVFDLAEGTWHWSVGEGTCQGNRHRIAFSDDRTQMMLIHDEPLDAASDERVTVYTILQSGAGLHPMTPYVIRAAMEGETRTTEAGESVVWDLVIATPDRYHWRRTDWPTNGLTGAIIRCDDRVPLEQWPPAVPRGPVNPST
jgi:hypothetical protein